MYIQSDPRSALAATEKPKAGKTHDKFFGSQLCLFYGTEPQVSDHHGDTWISRGGSFVVAYSRGAEGGLFSRSGQPDEYAVILPEKDMSVEITTAEGTPFEPWPEPPGGLKLRWYTLDVPDDPSRFGRIYRCTTFMINYLNPRIGPRERDKVSPHHHDDFEQCSLALSGAFTHHLRWPWTTNMNVWREDEHLYCESPSICVIPPPSIHTTTAEGSGVNQLVDIFAPPRLDFSLKPGWVLNEADYPMRPQQD